MKAAQSVSSPGIDIRRRSFGRDLALSTFVATKWKKIAGRFSIHHVNSELPDPFVISFQVAVLPIDEFVYCVARDTSDVLFAVLWTVVDSFPFDAD